MRRTLLSLAVVVCLLFSLSACDEQKSYPPRQQELIDLVQTTKKSYRDASTDLKREEAVKARHEATAKYIADDSTFSEFLVSVKDVQAKGGKDSVFTAERIVILTVAFDDITLKNVDLAYLDTPEGGITEQNPLFSTIAGLEKGDKILASGTFLKDSSDNMREMSLTDSGSMADPDFAVIFTDVKKAE